MSLRVLTRSAGRAVTRSTLTPRDRRELANAMKASHEAGSTKRTADTGLLYRRSIAVLYGPDLSWLKLVRSARRRSVDHFKGGADLGRYRVRSRDRMVACLDLKGAVTVGGAH